LALMTLLLVVASVLISPAPESTSALPVPVVAATRLSLTERAYPGDWPARAGPVLVAVGFDQRERRARWALGTLVIVVLVRAVVARLWT
jgi:hypothetical protein